MVFNSSGVADEFEYYSDKDKTYEYIQKMQKAVDPKCEVRAQWELDNVTKALRKIAYNNCNGNKQCSEKLYEKIMLKSFGSMILPTRCESYISYGILSRLVKIVESIEIDKEKTTRKFPKFGTFLSPSFNASVTEDPYDNGYIVLFNYTLFTHINEFVKAVLYYEEIKNSSNSQIKLEHLIFSLARNTAYIITKGRVRKSENLPFVNLTLDLLQDIVDTIELFVVFHEYSHVKLNHTASHAMPLEYAPNISHLNRGQKQELAADLLASETLEKHLSKSQLFNNHKSEKIHGDVMFLTMVEIFEDAMKLAEKKIENTHPTAKIRLSVLFKNRKNNYSDHDLGMKFRQNALLLWSETRSSYQKLLNLE